MKKISVALLTLIMMICISISLSGCTVTREEKSQGSQKVESSEQNTDNSSKDTANKNDNTLGNYTVEIKSCRLAKSYDGKPVAIVTYGFTNNAENATSFMVAVHDQAFQNGIECEKAYVLENSANYKSDNQMKDLKKGASLDVEAAYLIDTSIKKIEVEVSELISFNNDTITKTFELE